MKTLVLTVLVVLTIGLSLGVVGTLSAEAG